MITVIIVNFNGEADLGRCLASVDGADDALEIVVVDNASQDRSLAIVQTDFPDVRVLAQDTNLGFAAANNLAAHEAQGDLLLFLNSDAWLEPGALTLLRDRLASEPRAALAAPRLTYPDGSPQFGWSPARSVVGEVLQQLRNPFEGSAWVHGGTSRMVARAAGRLWYTAACIMVRAVAFRMIEGFDPRFFMYFEDVDLCIRLEAAGWRLVAEPRAVVRHRGGLASAAEVDEIYRPSQLAYYRKHRPGWELRLVERRLRRRFGSEALNRWSAGGGGR